ncbi:polyprenyl synthetase [Exiguobacterium sp. SL-10]|jgi:heptaprenyl diphosphate synthase|uniref:polyprenyl synthetase family protein n=1 Tax=unclassified Exiguobacterium TaxID=2644629 RepID=UPI00103BF6D6|nr:MULTISPECIES: polyprenyl synthetase family protein [unclassified Exiguobacterium]TCI23131.1 polyprenyl synthetase [Exiguobacterium sp. SL-9]TCI31927.1 polyprenyl synthetase [Exiguobacterium sp. SL-10]
MSLKRLYRHMNREIEHIDRFLSTRVQTDHPVIEAASKQLLDAGGKRIRPAFVLLSAGFGQTKDIRLTKVAASLELIHMASLVHDDVIDDAKLRRGKPTVMERYDERVAMYTGNTLFGEAIRLVSEIDSPDVMQIMADTMELICVGEINQIQDQYDWGQSPKRYLDRIARKTALLIETSCAAGAVVSGASPDVVKQLRLFGYDIGMAFQMTDDLLDFTAKSFQLGKPVGEDLKHGHKTLPLFYSAENPDFFDRLQQVSHSSDSSLTHTLVREVQRNGTLERSQRTIDRYVNRAIRRLDGLPDVPDKRSLIEIAEYIGKRKW